MVAFIIFKLLIFCGLFAFLSYFFVYKIVMKLMERRRIKMQGEAVNATVVDYKVMRDSEGGKRYYPVLQYTTKENQLVTVQSQKERYRKYEVGKQLMVYYLPAEPSKFFIQGLVPYIKLTSILLGFAGACLIFYEIIKTLRRI